MSIYQEVLNKYTEELPDNIELLMYKGAISSGIYRDGMLKDIDITGFYFLPPEQYLCGGIGNKPNETSFCKIVKPYDVSLYEFKYFITALLKSSPTIFISLFVDPKHIIKQSFYGKAIINNKDLFLSKKIGFSFINYAVNCYLHAANNIDNQKVDTAKEMMLAIKYLRMGTELLTDGNTNVLRAYDLKELIDLKSGIIDFNEAEKIYTSEMKKIKEAMKITKLPDKPDFNSVFKLSSEILYDYITSNFRK